MTEPSKRRQCPARLEVRGSGPAHQDRLGFEQGADRSKSIGAQRAARRYQVDDGVGETETRRDLNRPATWTSSAVMPRSANALAAMRGCEVATRRPSRSLKLTALSSMRDGCLQ
jgi:hypothetical protein